ncbi:MAG: LysM domain-containing protein [Caldilineaceae bacterium]
MVQTLTPSVDRHSRLSACAAKHRSRRFRGQTDALTHEVQPGETLSEIAKEAPPLERLMLLQRRGRRDAVMAGQRLIPPPEAIVTPPASTTTATISASRHHVLDAVTNPDGAYIDLRWPPTCRPRPHHRHHARNRRYTESGDTLAGINAACTGVETRFGRFNPSVDDSRSRRSRVDSLWPLPRSHRRTSRPTARMPTTQMTVCRPVSAPSRAHGRQPARPHAR